MFDPARQRTRRLDVAPREPLPCPPEPVRSNGIRLVGAHDRAGAEYDADADAYSLPDQGAPLRPSGADI
ncbi:hypothetical protein [Streptomyces sp. NPDC048425]|uniref:hypothetical protein n=1 Tax=Streptomyces sp. NPDC048425 TaxID=3365548 RepID=UPI0037228CE2